MSSGDINLEPDKEFKAQFSLTVQISEFNVILIPSPVSVKGLIPNKQ